MDFGLRKKMSPSDTPERLSKAEAYAVRPLADWTLWILPLYDFIDF